MTTSNLLFESIYPEEIYEFTPSVAVVISIPFSQITRGQVELLDKILRAVKLSADSVRILHQPQFDLSGWADKPKKILAFTDPPNGLASYEVIQTGDMSVIFSTPLEKLTDDEGAKRKLWTALQSLFPA